ncbi:MAG: hypothetical protein HQ596_01020, partial [Candidatus Saganbacteria bacterium]|nr:hypothetical protein [Candidatus Saganbacteria bacterium]
SSEIYRLNQEYKELAGELETISEYDDDPDYIPSEDEHSDWIVASDTKGPEASNLNARINKLEDLQGTISRILTMEKQTAENPVQFMANVDQLEEQLYLLNYAKPGIFDLGEDISPRGLGDDIEKRAAEALSSISGIRGSRDAYLTWVEAKQEVDSKKQEATELLTSDRFTREDYERLTASPLAGIVGDAAQEHPLAHHLTSSLGHVMVQYDDRIYGPFGRDSRFTALEALDNYFAGGGEELNLSMTMPEVGESLEKTYAKIAITKAFENIPQNGNLDPLMPLLLLTFGGHGGMSGLWNTTRDVACIGGRLFDFDDVSYGGITMERKAEIISNPGARALYYLAQGAAMSSNTISPPMPMASQLHYIMIYSPYGTEYLENKIEQAQAQGVDISTALSRVTQEDLDLFNKYVEEKVISEILRNPRLLRQIAHLVDPNSNGDYDDARVKSPLFIAILEDFNEALQYDNPEQIKTALRALQDKKYLDHLSSEYLSDKAYGFSPKEKAELQRQEGIELFDSFNEKRAPGLALLLEDMFKVTAELNKTRVVEDFEKQPLGQIDLAGRSLEVRVPYDYYATQEPSEHIEVLHLVAGQTEENHGWFGSKFARQGWNDTYIYGSQEWEAINEDPRGYAAYNAIDSISKVTAALDYGFMMQRRISMGFSDIWGGATEWVTNIGPGKAPQRELALHRTDQGITHTGSSFSLFEAFNFIFLFTPVGLAQQGRTGAAVMETGIILAMFGTSMKILWSGIGWGRNNLKIAGWDKLVKKHARLVRFAESVVLQTQPQVDALNKFMRESNGKYSYDNENKRLKVRGAVTVEERVRLSQIFEGDLRAQAGVASLARQSQAEFVPIESNAFAHRLSKGLGIRILGWRTGIKPAYLVINGAYREYANRSAGIETTNIDNTVRDITGNISVEAKPSMEIFDAGETDGAKNTDGWVKRTARRAKYHTALRSIIPERVPASIPIIGGRAIREPLHKGWEGLKATVSNAPGEIPGHYATRNKPVDFASGEGAMVDVLQRANHDQSGFTEITNTRAREGLAREVADLGKEIKQLEADMKKALASDPAADISQDAAKLKQLEARAKILQKELRSRQSPIKIKNSALIEMAETGEVPKGKYFTGQLGRGTLVEWTKIAQALKKIWKDPTHKATIETVPKGMEAPEGTSRTTAPKMLHEIARGEGATKTYTFRFEQPGPDGKPTTQTIHLRGDQIVKIIDAVNKGGMPNIAELGVRPDHAQLIARGIQSQFGQTLFKEFTRLINLGKKWLVSGPQPKNEPAPGTKGTPLDPVMQKALLAARLVQGAVARNLTTRQFNAELRILEAAGVIDSDIALQSREKYKLQGVVHDVKRAGQTPLGDPAEAAAIREAQITGTLDAAERWETQNGEKMSSKRFATFLHNLLRDGKLLSDPEVAAEALDRFEAKQAKGRGKRTARKKSTTKNPAAEKKAAATASAPIDIHGMEISEASRLYTRGEISEAQFRSVLDGHNGRTRNGGKAGGESGMALIPELPKVQQRGGGIRAFGHGAWKGKGPAAALSLVFSLGGAIASGEDLTSLETWTGIGTNFGIGSGTGLAFMGTENLIKVRYGLGATRSLGAAGAIISSAIETYEQSGRVFGEGWGHGWVMGRGIGNIAVEAGNGAVSAVVFGGVSTGLGILCAPALAAPIPGARAVVGSGIVLTAIGASMATHTTLSTVEDWIAEESGLTRWLDEKELIAYLADRGVNVTAMSDEEISYLERYATNTNTLGAVIEDTAYLDTFSELGITQIAIDNYADLNAYTLPLLLEHAQTFRSKGEDYQAGDLTIRMHTEYEVSDDEYQKKRAEIMQEKW